MFEDYATAVMKLYEVRKASRELSLNLTHPTPGNLKKECMELFKKYCDRNDRQMLKSFLERPAQEQLYSQTIRAFDRDKFKPLINFLKKRTKTHEKNIELLAWLIDFKPRPYIRYCKLTENNDQCFSNRLLKSEDSPALQRKVDLSKQSLEPFLTGLFEEVSESNQQVEYTFLSSQPKFK